MESSGIYLRGSEALSLNGIDVHEHGTAQLFCRPKSVLQLGNIVTVDRSQVYKTHILKHCGVVKNRFQRGF